MLGCAGVLPTAGILAAARAGESANGVVALRPEIEPVVRLLEDTPRDKLLERAVARVRQGLSYRDALAALLLAAVRNVEPRPSVGFKFHAVLVVQSVHLAAMALPEADRWLPVFWAMDYFKDSQARDERERGWTMGPVDESAVPAAEEAPAAFARAMEQWDEPAADAAVAGLARSARPEAIWEHFFRYGARDYRSIGHKAIDVANTHRVLGVIGWQHAEPALRSLAYALLMHDGGNPADRDDPADRPWRRNQPLAEGLSAKPGSGTADRAATMELVQTLRTASENDASDKVAGLMRRGVAPESIWDALFLAAGELLVRQPGIVALHSVTTTNALHYAYRAAREDRTRVLILLENAAFLPMFRQSMQGRGPVRDFAIEGLDPLDSQTTPDEALDEIFADVGRDGMTAARNTLTYLGDGRPLGPWIDRARDLLIRKGSAVHDYKFASAVFEDASFISQDLRPFYLASSVFSLQGSGKSDNPLIHRARKALAG
jgi:hypothetical protein